MKTLSIPNRNISRRRLLAAAAGMATVSALGFLPLQKARASTPKQGGTLRFGVGHGSTTDTLDPGTFDNNFTIGLDYMLHNHLAELMPDGRLSGEVAESWEASSDAKAWKFKIRKGIEFHDGRTVTPADVVASINYHRKNGSKSAAAPLVKPILDVKADGSDSVTVILDAGNADLPYILADYHIPILPSIDGEVDSQFKIGCGPYKFRRWEPGVRATVTRHQNYWKEGRAHFDGIEMSAIIDIAARSNALITGEIDAMDRCDLHTLDLLKRNKNISVLSVTGNQHYTFPMLTDVGPFVNAEIRMALKLSCPREEMVQKILRGHGRIGNDNPIGPTLPFAAKNLPQRPYDPEKAKWYIQKSGVGSLKVQLSAADAAFTGAVDAALLYAEAARPAGIEIEVIREANDGYWTNVWTKKPWCACYWSGRPTIDATFSLAYVPGVSWNDTNWNNPRFVELVTQGRAELDQSKRAEIYNEAQALLSEDGGTVVPMFANYVYATSTAIAHDDVATNWDMDGQKFSERWWFS